MASNIKAAAMSSKPAALTTLIDTDTVRISFSPGESGRAVVAFAGIGLQLGGIQVPEFQQTLSATGARNAVYYVIDKKRSWYEFTFDAIAAFLQRELTAYDTATTIGNSMGGFGALLFAGALPRCTRALAFTPQFSLAAHVVGQNEKRWPEYRAQIARWTIDHARVHLRPAVDCFVLFGGRVDRWHRDKFRGSAPNLAMYEIGDADHELARYLRGKQVLTAAVNGVVNEGLTFDGLHDLLRSRGVDVEMTCKALPAGAAAALV